MTRLLALETATPASSVALGEGPDLVASSIRVDARGHEAFLISAVDFCFDQSGWQPSELDAVIVDIGPGLYTGIRVGLATAQGLAAALGVPIITVSSLDAIALRAATRRRDIWAIVDVRRGELAAAEYRPLPGGVVREGSPELTNPDALRGVLESAPEEILLVGDTEALPDGFTSGLHRVKTGRPRYPTPDALLELGAGKLERGEELSPSEVRPFYLREPDVTINWQLLREEGPWQGWESP
ncbi:MAG: tRNA (adenosine(37)-N6)-threonylcarbamoyltransferase complex dimerization subunit type 1 TsaB [Acidimicrobiia bacterium]